MCLCVSVVSSVACVCYTAVVHLKSAVMKLQMTHSLTAAAPNISEFLPFISYLLGEVHSPQAAYVNTGLTY